MSEKQTKFFIEKLKKSKGYLEFGCGGSTIEANKYCDKIISIDNCLEWINKVKDNAIDVKRIEFNYINMPIQHNNWGHPTLDCPDEDKRKYSQIIDDKDLSMIDLVLIDGRFRVACALHIFNKINDNAIILFDDYIPRKYMYGIIENYYDIVNVIDNNMVELKKKTNVIIDNNIIKKYEIDGR